MDFFINKGSTLPFLHLELIKDTGFGFKNDFNKCIQTANITFCMKDVKTGRVVVPNKQAICVVTRDKNNPNFEEYSIGYSFNKRETSIPGKYKGEFTFNFIDGNVLIVPIAQELFIHVLDK